MPGAQPRRSPVVRAMSAARRGANVPAGVPGVYRVPRVRPVTITSDPGSPAAAPPGWIQPENQVEVTNGPGWHSGVTGNSVSSGAFIAEAIDTVNRLRTVNADGAGDTYSSLESGGSIAPVGTQTCLTLAESALMLAPWEPDPVDWPPGATDVEFESARGELVSVQMTGTVLMEGGGGGYIARIYRVTEALYTPGDVPDCGWYTPGEVSTMSLVVSLNPSDGGFVPTDVDEAVTLDASGCAVFAVVFDEHLAPSAWPQEETVFAHISSLGADRIKFHVTYTPPRYRFVF